MPDQAAILARLTSVFVDVFDDPNLAISRDTSAKDVAGWDSFAHINLVVGIEETFDIRFTTREIGSFTCVGDVLDLLAQKTLALEPTRAAARSRRLHELAVGQRADFTVRVTLEMVTAFAALSGDRSPLHTDEAFAHAAGFDGRAAHGLLLGALVSRLIGMQLPGAHGVLQSVELSFRRPLVPPATVRVEGEIAAISESTGQVQIKVTIVDEHGRGILEGKARSVLRPV